MATKPSARLERHCLVTVGATARFTQLLTEVLSAAFLDFIAESRYTHLTLQCGKDYADFSRQMLPPLLNRYPGIEITAFDFVDDLTTEMVKCRAQPGVREAGVVICHAGTGTILDGMRVSVPLVVVPNPTLKDNHQVELAEEIQRQGYGIWGRLGDISWALEQLALQLDKTEQQYRPHPVGVGSGSGAAADPVDVNLWQVSSALMNRYSDETGPAVPRRTKVTDGGGAGEVQREEVAQMTMG
ncbi:glycosyltransferase family 28 domain-containing protein [Colletotrichum orchidophilum]|uniref:UDP-N-acetylglucosamine transferase subunit ALG13 n=1 Tax=Colletotrichum orchidophilum TaxID=1209926 RepID=A0A1G4B1S7_9PEZI|nr:glycosyltransferase family 28 domain-containing protein [Colletotrichum orchidophilum]OHE95303.1 glycosyltransferase family 28 domain-containing protein [Colletotrichum orchidophilum]